MCHRFQQLAVVVIIAVMSAGAWAAPTKAKAPRPTAVEQPQGLFRKADSAFAKGQKKAAATAMLQAAAILRMRAKGLSKEDQVAVDGSATEVGKLAQNMTKTNAGQMRHAFARAELALARHHQRQAAAAWAKKKPAPTGASMAAAAQEIEYIAAWIAFQATPQQLTDNANIGAVGRKLARGAKVDAAEVGKALAVLDSEVSGLISMIWLAK